MAEKIQELIDKIKTEGVVAAQSKAKEIEDQARKNAQKIVDDAEGKAKKIILDAKEEIKKNQESTEVALRQSSRDTILSLKKEIDKLLTKVISFQIKDALTTDQTAKILNSLVSKAADAKGIQIHVSPEDLAQLQNGALAGLQKELKKPIKLQASSDIGKGFTISFDEGKSIFDFTSEGLAEYLSTFLNPRVSELLKESVYPQAQTASGKRI